jgi:hypothetical protein
MKMQPEFEAIPMSHDPCYADSAEVYPALQPYTAGNIAADKCHEYILRAALLANGCAVQEPYKQ